MTLPLHCCKHALSALLTGTINSLCTLALTVWYRDTQAHPEDSQEGRTNEFSFAVHTVTDLKHLCNAKYVNTTCPLFALWPIHRALVVKSCSTSVSTIQGGHISVNVTCSNKWIFSDMSSKETRKSGNCL